jgi:hypothetical protein
MTPPDALSRPDDTSKFCHIVGVKAVIDQQHASEIARKN